MLHKVEKPVAPLNGDPNILADKNDELIGIGMGRTQEDGSLSKTLLSTEIYQVDHEKCQELYPEFLVNDEVVICATDEGRDRYDLSEQPPPFCQPLELPEGWIEKVRVDVEYDSKTELSVWTLFDDHHKPIINFVENSVPQEGVKVSTYADIFEVGKYEITTNDFQGKRMDLAVKVADRQSSRSSHGLFDVFVLSGKFKVSGLRGDGSSILITQGSGNSTFQAEEARGSVPSDSSTTPTGFSRYFW